MAAPALTFTDVTTTADIGFELVAAVEVERGTHSHIAIYESSGNDAEFSVDGGLTFSKLPASTGVVLDNLTITGEVQGRNLLAGADVILSGRIW